MEVYIVAITPHITMLAQSGNPIAEIQRENCFRFYTKPKNVTEIMSPKVGTIIILM